MNNKRILLVCLSILALAALLLASEPVLADDGLTTAIPRPEPTATNDYSQPREKHDCTGPAAPKACFQTKPTPTFVAYPAPTDDAYPAPLQVVKRAGTVSHQVRGGKITQSIK